MCMENSDSQGEMEVEARIFWMAFSNVLPQELVFSAPFASPIVENHC